MTAGCSDLDQHDDLSFRDSPHGVEFWEEDPERPGNGAIEVHDDDDTNIPDCIIWNIDGADVARQVQPGVFVEGLQTFRNEIFADDMSCSAFEEDHASGKIHKLVDDDGDVVLTLWNRRVFAGDVDALPTLQNPEGVIVSFKKDQIFSGHWSDKEVLATATANIEKANPMRQLLLGALVAGECGSAGLP